MKIFAKIRFFWGAFIIGFVVVAFMIPATYIAPNKKGRILHYFNRWIMFLIGGKVEQIGEADPSATLLIFNHQGIIDIVAFEALQTSHVSWVAKKELFEIPLFGKIMNRTDMISIDRENKSGLIKLIKDAKESIESKGRPVAIFPEGTRAKTQELLPFRAGTKFIANKLNMRVQPIVITGSKALLNEHEQIAQSATVKYSYLPSFDVKDMGEHWFDETRVQMQQVIDDELAHHSRSR
jgi:1-acyl-sn-glycerol-3-phosphate acyltransferase